MSELNVFFVQIPFYAILTSIVFLLFREALDTPINKIKWLTSMIGAYSIEYITAFHNFLFWEAHLMKLRLIFVIIFTLFIPACKCQAFDELTSITNLSDTSTSSVVYGTYGLYYLKQFEDYSLCCVVIQQNMKRSGVLS